MWIIVKSISFSMSQVLNPPITQTSTGVVPEGTLAETVRLVPGTLQGVAEVKRSRVTIDSLRARKLNSGRYLAIVSPLLLLSAWFLLSRTGWVSPEVLISPQDAASTFWDMVQSGDLWNQLSHSLYRLITGYAIGASIGLLLGTLMALSPAFEAYVYPSFQILRQLPTVALIPAFVMFFGVGETIKIVLVAKATALPVALAGFEAVRGIPRNYLDVASVYKIRPLPLLFKVVLPATVAPVLTGMRIALGRSWMVLVAAELLVSENGIGQMMEYGRQMFRLDTVIVCVVLTGVIGFVFDKSFRLLEGRLVRWQHR